MRTNIVLDDNLTSEAFLLTGLKTKKELVEFALKELIRLKRQEKMQGLCKIFKQLHQLKLDSNPFPLIERTNRPNLFADEL
jgi:hypothetical protein